MKKLLILLSLISLNIYSKSFFEAWTEWNEQNVEALINFVAGKKVSEAQKESAFESNEDNDKQPKKIRFKDIAGGVPQEILELKEFLEGSNEIYKSLGIDKPKGYLLAGPTGTGKTLLAKAVAGEIDAEFFSASASSFVELFVGNGPKRVRELFENAKLATSEGRKAIIFIDEIDSIGTRTDSFFGGGNTEYNNTINELLVQMDGFSSDSNIIVIAATNKPEALDSALKRPGRFDCIINVPLPDIKKREAILNHYLFDRPRNIDSEINIVEYAQKTEGFNCAELKDLVNKALINAVRNKRKILIKEDLETVYQELKKIKRAYR